MIPLSSHQRDCINTFLRTKIDEDIAEDIIKNLENGDENLDIREQDRALARLFSNKKEVSDACKLRNIIMLFVWPDDSFFWDNIYTSLKGVSALPKKYRKKNTPNLETRTLML